MIRKILGILVASSILAGAAMAYAIFIVDDQDTVPTNVLTSTSAVIIDVSVFPVSAVWSIPDMDPGELESSCFVLTNNGPDSALVVMSSSHTNTVLADQVSVAAKFAPTDTTPYLLTDGTASAGFTAGEPRYGPASLTGLALGGVNFTIAPSAVQQYCLTLTIPDGIADFASIASQSNTTTLQFDSTLAP